MLISFQQTTFIKSVAKLSQLPADEGLEVAFAGRSNAGKSSAINAITQSKNLAKTSKMPGRTQTINLFQITHAWRLVDLPGYGYANVPIAVKQQWQATLSAYLQTRRALCGLCIVMDIRHPLKDTDSQMLAWANAAKLPVHILLSKSDKLSHGASAAVCHQVEEQCVEMPLLTCQCFSAISGKGVMAARQKISQWLTR